jgi:hypothetical protein
VKQPRPSTGLEKQGTITIPVPFQAGKFLEGLMIYKRDKLKSCGILELVSVKALALVCAATGCVAIRVGLDWKPPFDKEKLI